MSPRDVALHELDARRLPHWRSELLEPLQFELSDPRDRALAEQIVAGVVKNLYLLDHLTAHYSKRSASAIDPLARKIIAIGLYQLRFLSRIPASAAVDEAVKQAKRFGLERAAGFVNAVLRNATREPDPPLPSADADPAAYAQIVLSHPPEVFARASALIGVPAALEFCRHNNAEPPTIVRLFKGVEPRELAIDGIHLTPHTSPNMLVVTGAKHRHLAHWAAAALAQVQDPTSASVVSHLQLTPGLRVMDRCCGMGTKTLQILDAITSTGVIVAVDPSARRCTALRQLLSARKINNVALMQTAMVSPRRDQFKAPFDRILIDTPCSNSGVLSRRPEARYFQDEPSLKSLHKLQDEILLDSADLVAPGGLMVYSTCSVWPSENQDRIAAFLRVRKDYQLVKEQATWPESKAPETYRDGGYWAVMRRT
jgi:16S rRNA (cytosine967-C5)-methyltransferase